MELPSVLDNILSAPDIGLLAPEHMCASMSHDEDEPPPWLPLRRPPAADMSAEARHMSSAPAASTGIDPSASSRSSLQAARPAKESSTGKGSAGSTGKPTRLLDQSKAEQRRQEVLHRARPDAASAKAGESQQDHSDAEAGSASSMQGARSQEGDFFRLLDSHGPAPRKSFQESDLQQLPRSFSTSVRGKAATLPASAGASCDELKAQSSNIAAVVQQEDEPILDAASEPVTYQDQDNAVPAGNGGAESERHDAQQIAEQAEHQQITPQSMVHKSEASSMRVQQSESALDVPEAETQAVGTSPDDPRVMHPLQAAEGPSAESQVIETSEEHAEPAAGNRQHVEEPGLLLSSRHDPHAGLLGGAASSDLSYTQLTALLGSPEAQEDDLSGLDDLTPCSSPRSDDAAVHDAHTSAEALVAHAEAEAEAAAAGMSGYANEPTVPAEAALNDMAAAQAQQGEVMLPDQHYSSAGEADLAETLEQARDEQRLGEISSEHVSKDLASNMQRLAALTERQGGPVTDAAHESHLRRLAELTGTCTCISCR